MPRKDQKMIQMLMKDELGQWLYIFDIFMSGKTKANVSCYTNTAKKKCYNIAKNI